MMDPATKANGLEAGRKQRQKIVPHLWFDSQAEEAANVYASLFDDSRVGAVAFYGKEGFEIHGQPEGKVLTVDFQLAGYQLIALNGGPMFEFTPAVSLFVICDSEGEIDKLWGSLSQGGEALMELDRYPWSEKYGWVKDRFGLTWQLSMRQAGEEEQKICPCLMYVTDTGLAQQAMDLYTSIFPNSRVGSISRYGPGEPQPEGNIAHATFFLDGELFRAMDTSPQYANFGFNEAISLLIQCEDQAEIDHYWKRLGAGGDPRAQQCGWLKDRFGLSWQVSPVELQQMILDPDRDKVDRVTKAFLQMKKFDLAKLREAFDGAA